MEKAHDIYIWTTTAYNDQLSPSDPPDGGLWMLDLDFGFNGDPPDDVLLLSYDIQGDVDMTGIELLKDETEEPYDDGQGHTLVRTKYGSYAVRIRLRKNTSDTYQESRITLHVQTLGFVSDVTDQTEVMEDGEVEFGVTLTADIQTEPATVPSDYDPEDEAQAKSNEKEVAAVQDKVSEEVEGMTSKLAPPIDVDALLLPIALAKSGGNIQIANVLKQVREMRGEVRRLDKKASDEGEKAVRLRRKETEQTEKDRQSYMNAHGGEEDPSDPFVPSYKAERFGEKASKAEKDKARLEAQRDNAEAEYCAFVKLHMLKSAELDDEAKGKIGGRHPGMKYREGMESEYGEDASDWPDDDIDREIKAYMEQEVVAGGLGRMVKEKLVMFKQQFAAVAQGVKDLMVSAQTTAMEPMGAAVVTPTGAGSVATNIPQIFNSLKRLSAAAASLILPITMALESARFLGLPKSVVTPLVGIARILVAINAIAGTL